MQQSAPQDTRASSEEQAENSDPEHADERPARTRQRQRRRILAAPLPSEPPRDTAKDAERIGDTIRYEAVTSHHAHKDQQDTAAAGEESPAKSDGVDVSSAGESSAEHPVADEDGHEETAADKPDSTEAQTTAAAPSRVVRRQTRKIPTKILVIIAICAVAVAAIGIWQWSVNTPRARMTQALRDGDIMLACEIYDDELREQGLTANEVYYLCAAAEKIADDFETAPTGDSYDGRVLLLDRLNSLPYRDVQDAVAAARKRLDARNSVVARLTAAAEAERRGDYIAAIRELEAARPDARDSDGIDAEITRLEDAFRAQALDAAAEYVSIGNIAQARLALLGAMLDERFAADSALRAELDAITNEQLQLEGTSGAARNSLDMARLGQAAFLMENVSDLPNATSHLTVDDLAGVLMGLYQWRDYNSSPIAGTDPVLAVIRDALPERTGNAQWPLRVAAQPVQLLCDALFGQRAENVNLAEALGGELFGSYKYEDGWYYFASMTVPSASVSYADTAPLPHLQDNTYRFYSASSDRNDDRLYEMEIRPTMTSPFGFTVSSVVTVAEGRDARAEAESAIQAQETPSPTASATAAASEAAPENAASEQAPPQFDYAPEGSLTGGMVFPDSDLRYLTSDDLSNVTELYSDVPAALELARNEIYARRGHIFSDPAYQDYFSQFLWYSPSHSVNESEFNEYELANLQQISAWRSGG